MVFLRSKWNFIDHAQTFQRYKHKGDSQGRPNFLPHEWIIPEITPNIFLLQCIILIWQTILTYAFIVWPWALAQTFYEIFGEVPTYSIIFVSAIKKGRLFFYRIIIIGCKMLTKQFLELPSSLFFLPSVHERLWNSIFIIFFSSSLFLFATFIPTFYFPIKKKITYYVCCDGKEFNLT